MNEERVEKAKGMIENLHRNRFSGFIQFFFKEGGVNRVVEQKEVVL